MTLTCFNHSITRRLKPPILSLFVIIFGFTLLISGCNSDTVTDADFEASDWTEDSHSKSASPNFEEVFDNNQVKRLDFVITEARWQSMLDDMTTTYGELGQRTASNSLIDSEEDPIFVPAEVFYNGAQWYRVGIRFKGNSSLQSSWQQGVLKLAFKLDFDEFEDDYPQIKNQRFFGFKKFSLKNNFDDSSLVREKIAADIFKSAGLAVSHTAFYSLYINHGNGPEYFGLYTLVEEIGDTVIETQFSSDNGNLYKPENGSASFSINTFSLADHYNTSSPHHSLLFYLVFNDPLNLYHSPQHHVIENRE